MDLAKRTDYALKVMKVKHRTSELIEICDKLKELSGISGMAACERVCLTEIRTRRGPAIPQSSVLDLDAVDNGSHLV